MEVEGQESGRVSSDAALAREGILAAALPTAEHVSLRQPSLAGSGTPQPVNLATSAPARTVNKSIQRASAFSAVNVEAAAALNCLSSYNEIVGKLNRLWDDQLVQINNVTEYHWKNPEFPLARIKKIMRIDEEVKMISSEVPLMLSKAVEIFVTELSLRAWLHTEESKRRTVQRSDIAMAITKQDMFDFLIDIVPREEIQLKSKAQTKQHSESEQLTPELLQLYLQHLAQQQQQQQTTTAQQKATQQTIAQSPQQQQQQIPTLLPPQQPQIQPQQQQQQQQLVTTQQEQQIVDGLEGDMDEASARIFQDNMALIQQLQQLLHLQVQMQQLQENTATGDHTQVLPTTTGDNIHRVTINAAHDMLSEPELITSLSGGTSRPSPHPSLLAPTTPLTSSSPSSSQQRREVTSIAMAIEPELVETGTLQSSPPGEEAVQDDTSLLETGGNIPPRGPNSVQHGPSLLSNTPGGRIRPLSDRQEVSLSQTRDFQQLEPLMPDIDNTMVVPEQYVIQTTPLLDLVSSSHTVTANPSTALSTTAVDLTGLVQQGVGLPVAKSDQLTPINATLEQPTTTSFSAADQSDTASITEHMH